MQCRFLLLSVYSGVLVRLPRAHSNSFVEPELPPFIVLIQYCTVQQATRHYISMRCFLYSYSYNYCTCELELRYFRLHCRQVNLRFCSEIRLRFEISSHLCSSVCDGFALSLCLQAPVPALLQECFYFQVSYWGWSRRSGSLNLEHTSIYEYSNNCSTEQNSISLQVRVIVSKRQVFNDAALHAAELAGALVRADLETFPTPAFTKVCCFLQLSVFTLD